MSKQNAPAADVLYTNVQSLAPEIFKRGAAMRNRVQGKVATGTKFDRKEFLQDCEVAVFNAFIALGGKVEQANEFSWKEREAELLDRAYADLEQYTKGSGTEFRDAILRGRRRFDRASIAGIQWTSWKSAFVNTSAFRCRNNGHLVERALGDSSGGIASGGHGVYQYEETASEYEQQEYDEQMSRLVTVIRDIVGESAATVLIQHYIEGTTIRDIARQQLTAEGEELEATVVERRRQRLSQQLLRTKQQLAAKLGSEWVDAYKQVAA